MAARAAGLAVVLLASGFGFVAPVCDCGVIPLARRLGAKGLPALRGDHVHSGRAGREPGGAGLDGRRVPGRLDDRRAAHGHEPQRGGDGRASGRPPDAPGAAVVRARIGGGGSTAPRAGAFADIVAHATDEYFDIAFFIVLGALFTAVTQTFVPRGDLVAIGGSRIGSVATLMPVATLLSICSEADAFVARAFASTFSVGALLAFMTIGQIVDLRNGLLLFRTLPGKLVALIVVVSYVLIFVEAVAVNRVLLGP